MSIQIVQISSTLTDCNKELSRSVVRKLRGNYDLLNLDGSITKIRNGMNFNDHVHICYVGGLENGEMKDTRTYKQMDALEVYVMYHILMNPSTFVTDANFFGEKSCIFDVEAWLKEIGVHKRHFLTECEL